MSTKDLLLNARHYLCDAFRGIRDYTFLARPAQARSGRGRCSASHEQSRKSTAALQTPTMRTVGSHGSNLGALPRPP